jgi:hypothetical protein
MLAMTEIIMPSPLFTHSEINIDGNRVLNYKSAIRKHFNQGIKNCF